MQRKLTAKTQFLNPKILGTLSKFAKGELIEPDSDETLLKRGTIYTIFHITGSAEFNPDVVHKVVHDVLHDTYFQSENISPTQSLEKAIAEVKDKVAHLANESISEELQEAKFNIISGVLWGNVLYIVKYGSAQAFILKEGEIRKINAVSEGAFAAASEIVSNDQVVILCSEEFAAKYPPEKLLTMAIREQDLKPEEACILIKFVVDTKMSPREEIDFGLPKIPEKKEKNIFGRLLRKTTIKLKDQVDALSNRFGASAEKQKNADDQIQTIGDVGSQPKIKLRKQRTLRLEFLKNPLFLVIVVLLALSVSIYATIQNKGAEQDETPIQNEQNKMPEPVVEGAATEATAEQDEEVFFDLKITDSQGNPTSIAAFNQTVVVADENTGKIYTSDRETANFKEEPESYPGIKNLINIGGKLGFTNEEGYKVYNLTTQELDETYAKENLNTTSAYLGFVYELNEDKILRYSKSGNTLTESLWGQNADFRNAKGLAVSYSIYVVTSEGELVKYTSGIKNDFDTEVNNADMVIADIDFDYIYVASKSNKEIIVLNTDGTTIKTIKPKSDSAWNDIRGFAISSDEKNLFVLDGSKVYKLGL